MDDPEFTSSGPCISDSKSNSSNTMEPEQFQKFVYELFDKNGVMNDLRAYLRKHIVDVLKSSQKGDIPSCQKHFTQRLELPSQAINMLILEYFLRFEYSYSLSVFASEIPLGNMVFSFAQSLQEDTHDYSRRPRFTDNDIWGVLNYLGIKCDSEYACNVIDMYKTEKDLPLLVCIIRCMKSCSKSNTPVEPAGSSETSSPSTSEHHSTSHTSRRPQEETCHHYSVCKICQGRTLRLKDKYRRRAKICAKKKASINSMNGEILMKKMTVIEKGVIEETMDHVRSVYDAELEMARAQGDERATLLMVQHDAQLQRRKDQLEESYRQRAAELENGVAAKKRFLWGLARALRDQHRRLARAMLAVTNETRRIADKENNLKEQIATAEETLRQRGDDIRLQISQELVALQTHVDNMKKERCRLHHERKELDEMREKYAAISALRFHGVPFEGDEVLKVNHDNRNGGVSVIKRVATAKQTPRCIIERSTATDNSDASSKQSCALNNEHEDCSRREEVKPPNQLVNDIKKHKNVNFDQIQTRIDARLAALNEPVLRGTAAEISPRSRSRSPGQPTRDDCDWPKSKIKQIRIKVGLINDRRNLSPSGSERGDCGEERTSPRVRSPQRVLVLAHRDDDGNKKDLVKGWSVVKKPPVQVEVVTHDGRRYLSPTGSEAGDAKTRFSPPHSPNRPRSPNCRSPNGRYSPAHSPRHSPRQSPHHSPPRSPQNIPSESPRHSPAYSPRHGSPRHSPPQSANHSPRAQSPRHSPPQSLRGSPVQYVQRKCHCQGVMADAQCGSTVLKALLEENERLKKRARQQDEQISCLVSRHKRLQSELASRRAHAPAPAPAPVSAPTTPSSPPPFAVAGPLEQGPFAPFAMAIQQPWAGERTFELRPRTAPASLSANGFNSGGPGSASSMGWRLGAGEELRWLGGAPRVLSPGEHMPFIGVVPPRDAKRPPWRGPRPLRSAATATTRQPLAAPPAGRAASPPAPAPAPDSPPSQVNGSPPKRMCIVPEPGPSNDAGANSLSVTFNGNIREKPVGRPTAPREKSPKSVLREAKQNLRNKDLPRPSVAPREKSPASVLREAKQRLRRLEAEAEAVERSYRDFRKRQDQKKMQAVSRDHDEDNLKSRPRDETETKPDDADKTPHDLQSKVDQDNGKGPTDKMLTDFQSRYEKIDSVLQAIDERRRAQLDGKIADIKKRTELDNTINILHKPETDAQLKDDTQEMILPTTYNKREVIPPSTAYNTQEVILSTAYNTREETLPTIQCEVSRPTTDSFISGPPEVAKDIPKERESENTSQESKLKEYNDIFREYETKFDKGGRFINRNAAAVRMKPIPAAFSIDEARKSSENYIETPIIEFRKLYHQERRSRDDIPTIMSTRDRSKSPKALDSPVRSRSHSPPKLDITEMPMIPTIEYKSYEAIEEQASKEPTRKENERHEQLEILKENINKLYNLDGKKSPSAIPVTSPEYTESTESKLATYNATTESTSVSGRVSSSTLQPPSSKQERISPRMTIIISPKRSLIDVKGVDRRSVSPEQEARLTRNDVLDAIYHTDVLKDSSIDMEEESKDEQETAEEVDYPDDFSADVDNYNTSEYNDSPISLPKASGEDSFWYN